MVRSSKYFEGYKKLFIEKLKKNNIDIIYVVKPLWGAHNIIKDTLNKNCFIENNETEILEDLIIAAHNDAKSKLKKKTSEEISKVTGGIDLPPGFKLPF